MAQATPVSQHGPQSNRDKTKLSISPQVPPMQAIFKHDCINNVCLYKRVSDKGMKGLTKVLLKALSIAHAKRMPVIYLRAENGENLSTSKNTCVITA